LFIHPYQHHAPHHTTNPENKITNAQIRSSGTGRISKALGDPILTRIALALLVVFGLADAPQSRYSGDQLQWAARLVLS
jgi:hypothetical protein